jgi:hypothetical protein
VDYKDDPEWKQWGKPALQKVFLKRRPGEYMNGMDCEECSKSCYDMRERDQLGTMLCITVTRVLLLGTCGMEMMEMTAMTEKYAA